MLEIFVHLRRIHFTLVITSVALIGISGIVSQEDLKRAKKDLELIEHWPLQADWLQKYCESIVLPQISKTKLDTLVATAYYLQENDSIRAAFTVDPSNWLINPSSLPSKIIDWESYDKWRLTASNGQVHLKKPETIEEFSTLWNAVDSVTVAIATLRDLTKISASGSVYYRGMGDHPHNIALSKPRSHIQTEKVRGSYSWDTWLDEATGEWMHDSQISSYKLTYFFSRPYVSGLELSVKLDPDIKRIYGARKHLSQLMGLEPPRQGVFRVVFQELNKVTQDWKHLDFRNINLILDTLLDSGQYSVQVFGATIPVSLVRDWGPLTLIFIQLYLFLHMRYAITSETNFPNNFPWIPLYPGWLPSIFFVLSAGLLPIASVSWIVWEWFLNTSGHWPSIGFIFILSSGILGVTTTMVYRKLSNIHWRN